MAGVVSQSHVFPATSDVTTLSLTIGTMCLLGWLFILHAFCIAYRDQLLISFIRDCSCSVGRVKSGSGHWLGANSAPSRKKGKGRSSKKQTDKLKAKRLRELDELMGDMGYERVAWDGKCVLLRYFIASY